MQFDPVTAHVLGRLKAKLSEILGEFDNSARIVYVDYPVHLNIGDLLINQGAELFFAENKLNIWKRYYVLDVPQEIPGIDDSVVFMLHGGGNFGDVWTRHQQMRENLLARYPWNRFVFLPQTVFFSDKELERKCLANIAQHGNSKVYGRDAESTEILRQGGISGASSMPDMAHMLWKHLKPCGEPVDENPFCLIRRDCETRGTNGAELAISGLPTVDWLDTISSSHLMLASVAHRVMHVLARLNVPVQKTQLWYPVRDRAVHDGVCAVSRHRSVITDRLHAMILGLLLGRRVTASDNSYGKLLRYANTWLKEIPLLDLVPVKAEDRASVLVPRDV